MHKFNTITEIHYQGVDYKVDAHEYGTYQSLLEEAKGDTVEEIENHEQWITYNFLIDCGIFVSEPMLPNPEVVGEQPYKGKESPTKLLNPEVFEKAKQVFENPSYVVREDSWTQERVYKEAQRNLAQQAKLIAYNQELFRREMDLEYARKLANKKRIPQHIGGIDFKIYNKDGSELSLLDLLKFGIIVILVIWLIAAIY